MKVAPSLDTRLDRLKNININKKGIDYDETFAIFARFEVIRIFLTDVAYYNFKGFKMNVKSTILNGELVKKSLG